MACQDPVEPPLSVFSVTPVAQWSGGAITIRSAYFANNSQAPVIVAAAETLALAPLDDSTVTATLPPGRSGPVVLSLARGARLDSLGTVQRIGFRESRLLNPSMMGQLLIVDSAGHPLVMGNVTTSSSVFDTVGRIDLVTGAGQTLRTLRGTSEPYYGLSPSVGAGRIIARDTSQMLWIYDVLVSPPQAITNTPFGSAYVRQLAQLSPGLWLHTSSHWSYTRGEGDTVAFREQVQTESPWSLEISPRGDRTTMTVNVAFGGIPVFDNATGSKIFTLPLQGAEAIAFTPDGSVIYAVGGGYIDPDTIVMVDATTGASLHSKVRLPQGFIAFGAAYTTRGGENLLIGAANTTTLALLVYDAESLELRGILPAPADCGANPISTSTCWDGIVAVDDARNLAYIMIPGSAYFTTPLPNPVWSFDLLSSP